MEAQVMPRGRLFLPRNPRVLSTFSDERLVEQVRRGNETAFETLYDRHHLAILSFCRHMLSSAHEAEDAVQQTFISAYSSLGADDREIRFKPWLYTIARNRCLSMLRARRERPAELEEVPTVGLSHEVEDRADLREILHDLRELPEDQRAALVLSELGDLSHAEVGAVVGCEAAKVKSLVFQARSSLIESRKAREIPCKEIREQLATLTGGALRRGPLRKHVAACEGCAEFRDEVRKQRRALAAILPVVPSLGLKKSALAAMGLGGGGGGAAVGGGWIASLAGTTATVKAVGVLAVTGLAVGGGAILTHSSPPATAVAEGGQAPSQQSLIAPIAAAGGPGVQAKMRTTSGGAAHHGPASRTALPQVGTKQRARSRPGKGHRVAPDPATGNVRKHAHPGRPQRGGPVKQPGMRGPHGAPASQHQAAPAPAAAGGGGNRGHSGHRGPNGHAPHTNTVRNPNSHAPSAPPGLASPPPPPGHHYAYGHDHSGPAAHSSDQGSGQGSGQGGDHSSDQGKQPRLGVPAVPTP